MAAGKKCSRLKLKIDTRPKLDMNPSESIIENASMASAPDPNPNPSPSSKPDPDQAPASPMDSAAEPISPLGYPDQESVPPQQPMSRASASLAAARRRKSSKGAMMSALRRSASTPNVRGLVAQETMSLADKRRNKLGYHRTSVACGRYHA